MNYLETTSHQTIASKILEDEITERIYSFRLWLYFLVNTTQMEGTLGGKEGVNEKGVR